MGAVEVSVVPQRQGHRNEARVAVAVTGGASGHHELVLEHHGCSGSGGGSGRRLGSCGAGADLVAAELGGEAGGVVVGEDDIAVVGGGGRRFVGPGGAGGRAEGGEHLLEEVVVGSRIKGRLGVHLRALDPGVLLELKVLKRELSLGGGGGIRLWV